MRIRLIPDPEQIRWYANAALGGVDTLDAAEAMEIAKNSMQGLLAYLDALETRDDAVFELGSEAIKSAGELELRIRDPQLGNPTNLKVSGS